MSIMEYIKSNLCPLDEPSYIKKGYEMPLKLVIETQCPPKKILLDNTTNPKPDMLSGVNNRYRFPHYKKCTWHCACTGMEKRSYFDAETRKEN